MNNNSLMQTVLGEDWDKLPAVIQRHYQLSKTENLSTVVNGSMRINFPGWIKPMLVITRLMGALIDLKGDDMQVSVKKWITDNPLIMNWQRDITAPDGRTTVFASRMEYLQDNELIEFVGLGFGIRLKVYVENNQLIYRSNGHQWQCGWIKIPIPDVFVLGNATIIETPIDDEKFELDFKIHHPIFGKTYEYKGVFHYQ